MNGPAMGTTGTMGTDIFAGFAENQIIAGPAVLLAFERPAALRWPRR